MRVNVSAGVRVSVTGRVSEESVAVCRLLTSV